MKMWSFGVSDITALRYELTNFNPIPHFHHRAIHFYMTVFGKGSVGMKNNNVIVIFCTFFSLHK